ncbi:aminotransferase class V-fold PLP-dependent enzyme [Arenibaculum pallidiluteum]|uniref:aminotransferase class V-fold PLP-dependent enzyme n=1 Tax=Arenibaculum pallidiluteum TaxID=2812559 RepID=UPI001A96BD21|nr:aminotransferase class V-fold PLP-dependent enzyme [Arenibaculum pallidiluteum]
MTPPDIMTLDDVERVRAQTPGCATLTHFNHSSCSLPSLGTLRAVTEHLQREAFLGPSEAGIAVADAVQETRRAAAALLNCDTAEIALTGSGSQGWGSAFAALPPLRPGDRILVGRHEWGGNLATMHAAADRAGASVETIPCAEDSTVSPEALAGMIDSRVRLIALTWLPANGGLINPAAAIGGIARAAGIPYFVDAGQALGQVPADVREIGCDVLKGAGRKYLRGPRGTALLYVRRGFLDTLRPAFLDVLSAPWTGDGPALRDDARRFETSENAFALQLGLGAAIRECLALGVPTIRTRIDGLAERLRAALGEVQGVTLRDLGTERSAIVSFTVAGMGAQEARRRLADRRINLAAIGAGYTPLDMRARGLSEVVRASVSYFTTEEEIDRLAASVAALG